MWSHLIALACSMSRTGAQGIRKRWRRDLMCRWTRTLPGISHESNWRKLFVHHGAHDRRSDVALTHLGDANPARCAGKTQTGGPKRHAPAMEARFSWLHGMAGKSVEEASSSCASTTASRSVRAFWIIV